MFSLNLAYDLDLTNNDDVDALTELKGMAGDTLGIAPVAGRPVCGIRKDGYWHHRHEDISRRKIAQR